MPKENTDSGLVTQGAAATRENRGARSKSILLIDDTTFARELYRDCLVSAGFSVDVAATGQHGLRCFREIHYDIVLTDLCLPDIDGIQVLQEVRRCDPDVGVLLMTASDSVPAAVRAMKAGAFDYLLKPIDQETLLVSLERCLAHRQLLRENADLKRHVALFRVGSQMLSCEWERDVFELVSEALFQNTGAIGAMVVEQRIAGDVEVLAHAGVPVAQQEVVKRLTGLLPDCGGGPTLFGVDFDDTQCDGCLVPITTAQPRKLAATIFGKNCGKPSADDYEVLHFVLYNAAQAVDTLFEKRKTEDLIFVDDLTKLYNTRYLDQVLDTQIENSGKRGDSYSLLFIDLDHFKKVNDNYGHLVGSQVLTEVATLISDCIRGADIATRYGGDEFVVVLPATDKDDAVTVAERIRRSLQQYRFKFGGNVGDIRLTASIGVACWPRHTEKKETLIQLADQAMYSGKAASRNCVYLAASQDGTLT